MDSRGHIHMLDDAEAFAALSERQLTQVPIQLRNAAEDAWVSGQSLFDSRNRRAAAWARHNAHEMNRAANRKRRNRKASKAAKIARRAHR